MKIDNEMLEIFVDEMGELKYELLPVYERLKIDKQQPELFLKFSQVVDRIYGTATTMGFKELGEYFGAVRNTCRKCGNSKIPRAMPEVFKVVKNCMDDFDNFRDAFQNQQKLPALMTKIKNEIIKIEKLDKEIFDFTKSAKTIIK